MIGERLTWEKIQELYPNHWVILLDVVYKDGIFGKRESGILHCAVDRRSELINYIPNGGFSGFNALIHTKRRV